MQSYLFHFIDMNYDMILDMSWFYYDNLIINWFTRKVYNNYFNCLNVKQNSFSNFSFTFSVETCRVTYFNFFLNYVVKYNERENAQEFINHYIYHKLFVIFNEHNLANDKTRIVWLQENDVNDFVLNFISESFQNFVNVFDLIIIDKLLSFQDSSHNMTINLFFNVTIKQFSLYNMFENELDKIKHYI